MVEELGKKSIDVRVTTVLGWPATLFRENGEQNVLQDGQVEGRYRGNAPR